MTTHRYGQPVAKEATTLITDRLNKLKQLFPEAFSEGTLDLDRLRVSLGDLADGTDTEPERYVFAWAGKHEAIRSLRAPTRATLVPRPDESVDFGQTQNIFIEGDNLEVLKLLYKSYCDSIKLIYIDPPYNTGHDFIYPDNYADSLKSYLRLTGQQDAGGNLLTSNPETSGRYHSKWLSMMYPRLHLARQLLRQDGVICVSIDNNEFANLQLLMNQVFGQENLIGVIIVQSNPRGRQLEKYIATAHEYLLIYARDRENAQLFHAPLTEKQRREYRETDASGRRYRLLGLRKRGAYARRTDRPNLHFPIYVHPATGEVSTERTATVKVVPRLSDGTDGVWRWSKAKVERDRAQLEARIVSGRNEWDIFERDYLVERGQEKRTMHKSLWLDKGMNYQAGKRSLKELFGHSPFDSPKPLDLLRRVLAMGSQGDDIILDFFAGSCTTAHAVLELNHQDGGHRRFIMIQLPEPTGSSQFPTIADIGKERIRRAIAKIRQSDKGEREELGFRVFKLAPSNYRVWDSVEPDKLHSYANQTSSFIDPLVPGWTAENVIYEVALKEGYGLHCRIEPVQLPKEKCPVPPQDLYRVTDPYGSRSFCICLDDHISLQAARALSLEEDDLFICRAAALNDETATHLALQCGLKTI